MFTKENCIDYILQKIPQFQNSWDKHREYWEDEDAGLCNDISSFTYFTIEKINSTDEELLIKIFGLAEELLINGDEDVRTAITTCFLENLLNNSSAKVIDASDFIKFLGENSKLYCKKWDNFTGVKTSGL